MNKQARNIEADLKDRLGICPTKMNKGRELLKKNKRKIGVKNNGDAQIQGNGDREVARQNISTGVQHLN